MAYGLNFEGKLGNSCFSDATPSMVFMGKATKTSNYGVRTGYQSDITLDTYNITSGHYRCSSMTQTTMNYAANGGNSLALKNKVGNHYHLGWCYSGGSCGCGFSGNTYTNSESFPDNARTLDYEIESYDKPIIFIYYNSPGSYGGLVVKVVDKGTTGPRGYPVWTITVLLYYGAVGQSATAADQITLYCFSEIPPSYSSSNWGLHIKNSSNQTMFHSDWSPCHIRELMTITTGTDPTTDFASSLLDPSGASMPSKACYLSQDWGRLYSYTLFALGGGDVRFEYMNFPASVQHVSGDDFTAHFGQIGISDYTYTTSTKSVEFKGASTVVWPIINGADYD